ncbi:hypothetical protein R3P38DRAFT_1024447 [Favolaschia claudopus]|uniref:Uncharacterized protein n=1 Tax=Favolaschia claudopus TaxID=2862362 RepID=A0AAW0BJ67_9AGAR
MASSSMASTSKASPSSPPPTAHSWAPAKNPLPPHRLAKLANALGVSMPLPAIHTPSSSSSNLLGQPSSLDPYRRSPTPSSASTFSGPAATSKYLLHVIPPLHLPHDSAAFDSDMTPPPSTASGYHTQFRRGTLVPVHPTLQSQLGAIAKEYALPSTAGLILYLVSQPRSSSSSSTRSPPPSERSFPDPDDPDDPSEEPGPRLSEEIWRHLWTRVVKSEMESLSSQLAPPLLGIGPRLSAALTVHQWRQRHRARCRPRCRSASPTPVHTLPNHPILHLRRGPHIAFSHQIRAPLIFFAFSTQSLALFGGDPRDFECCIGIRVVESRFDGSGVAGVRWGRVDSHTGKGGV